MNQITFLAVDDSEDDCFLIEKAFRKANSPCSLLVFQHGDQVIEHLNSKDHPLPRLVIADLKMPKVSGFDLLRWMRQNERTKLVPMVMLTSSSQPADIKLCYELGANSYLVKPSSFDSLVELLRLIHGFWLNANLTTGE